MDSEIRARNEVALKLETLRTDLAQARLAFEAVDGDLTAALGRKALGEIDPDELKTIQSSHDDAASKLRGLMAGESLLKDRLREAEATVEKARRAGVNERAALAAPILDSQIQHIRRLATELAGGIVFALQLDHAVTREGGYRSGQGINELFGDLFAVMSERGVEISGSSMGPSFRLNMTPATLTKSELEGK